MEREKVEYRLRKDVCLEKVRRWECWVGWYV